MNNNKKVLNLPVIILNNQVMLPGNVMHFDVASPASSKALSDAVKNGEQIFLVAKNGDGGVSTVGCISSIRRIMQLNENSSAVRVFAVGETRAVAASVSSEAARCSVTPVEDSEPDESGALKSKMYDLKQSFADLVGWNFQMEDAARAVKRESSPGRLCDLIAGNIDISPESRQEVLEDFDVTSRLERVDELLGSVVISKMLDSTIEESTQKRMDDNQRDFYLHEKLKAIYDELGEGEDTFSDADEFKNKIAAAPMPDECKEKLMREVKRFTQMPPSSPDSAVSRAYLEKCLDLPWGVFSDDEFDLAKAEKILDEDHYGLDDVKKRIIESLAALRRAPGIKGQIICLAGPPGVGKTSVAKSIARATGRKYARVALGGVGDESEIRGHRRTYIGSMPGRIINAVIDAGTQNPLILLDEIDKLSRDYKGDPSSALLEVLDAEQNENFTDHYIDMPFDLSRVLFITTANDKYSIAEPLRDRMEIIDMSSYTAQDKLNIAKKHLIPKQLKEHNIKASQLKINDSAVKALIRSYTREAGVRQLERYIAKLCRIFDVKLLKGETEKLSVTAKNLEELLGAPGFIDDELSHEDETGLVNGLAWTSVGGEVLQVEVSVLDGSGKLNLTGSLGDVMKESAQTAVSFVRSVADRYGIEKDFYKTKDIHIHFPEGATPKDGPSAGVTIVTALVSALGNVPVRGDVAMTGEVTLRGRVLPIGGLKEKSMAAYTHSLKRVIMPYGNKSDLEKIDSAVRESIEFIPVKSASEVLDIALASTKKKSDRVSDGL